MNALRRLFQAPGYDRLKSVAEVLQRENERLRADLAAKERMTTDLWRLVRSLRDVNASLDSERHGSPVETSETT
jgi:hypothetical protein